MGHLISPRFPSVKVLDRGNNNKIPSDLIERLELKSPSPSHGY